jgi:predicted DCC family thiol-disulfide oxidoreductase YuxK
MQDETRTIALYDASCGFCRVTVAALMRWDRGRRIRFLAIESAEGARLLAALTPAERLRSAHAIDAGGRLRSAGAAAPALLAALPGGGPLAWLARRTPALVEPAYRAIAAARPLLGRAIPAAVRRAADRQIARRDHEPAHPLSRPRVHG